MKLATSSTLPWSKEIPEQIKKEVTEIFLTGKQICFLGSETSKNFRKVNLGRSGKPSKIPLKAHRQLIQEVTQKPRKACKDLSLEEPDVALLLERHWSQMALVSAKEKTTTNDEDHMTKCLSLTIKLLIKYQLHIIRKENIFSTFEQICQFLLQDTSMTV